LYESTTRNTEPAETVQRRAASGIRGAEKSAMAMLCATPATPSKTVSRRVLLVEDNPDGRETLRMLLRLWGHDVEVAKDGLGGVQKALDLKPDLAIVDIGLPFLDGYEVARRLRAAFGDKIFLIALTGYSRPQDQERAYLAGFDVHMAKPADLDQLSRLLS
jgi:CheY-like chemotaxis protein